MRYEGQLYFSKELSATDIVRIQKYLDCTPDLSKPNGGIVPFRLVDFAYLEWNEVEAFEMETILKNMLVDLKGLLLSGTIKCFDDDFPDNSKKLYVKGDKISILKIDDAVMDEKLLRCPHCQKVFKAEAFKEVTESQFVKDI